MLTRRTLLGGLLATTLAPSASAQYATTLRGAVAQIHVQETIRDLISLLNTRSGQGVQTGLQNILNGRADMSGIAQAVLQDRALGLNRAQLALFSSSFTTYLARKYAPGFSLLRGGRMDITKVVENTNTYAIHALGTGPNGATLNATWMVGYVNGVPRIFNFYINGASMLNAEKRIIAGYMSAFDNNVGAVSRHLLS